MANNPRTTAPLGADPRLARRLQTTLERLPAEVRPIHQGSVSFGPSLWVERFSYPNGLTLLSCRDPGAQVVSVHTWVRVGSRHERPPKTGLSHLFEHLMFGESQNLPLGQYDRLLEEAGADTNASTWLDFTQYSVNAPARALPLVMKLEAERLENLLLSEAQVAREKDVVANERQYRVEDDVEGAASERLWSLAYTTHPYRCPTIGWMSDIRGLSPEDCQAFYQTYYAAANLTLVVVGDFDPALLLASVTDAFGSMPAREPPVEDVQPEPPQLQERRAEMVCATPTEKLCIGYPGPALGDADYVGISLLAEILAGSRASRLLHRLVHELEMASDVRAFAGPFRDPGLFELTVTARNEYTGEQLLAIVDEEMRKILEVPVTLEELERARARFELGLLSSLETAEGKASTLGFHETLLGQPAAAWHRLADARRINRGDILRIARRYLMANQRSLVLVRRRTPPAQEGS